MRLDGHRGSGDLSMHFLTTWIIRMTTFSCDLISDRSIQISLNQLGWMNTGTGFDLFHSSNAGQQSRRAGGRLTWIF